jgi:hypothetical protein
VVTPQYLSRQDIGSFLEICEHEVLVPLYRLYHFKTCLLNFRQDFSEKDDTLSICYFIARKALFDSLAYSGDNYRTNERGGQ